MLKTAAEFDALMQEVLSGSDRAAQELFRDYEPYLLQAIRRRLSKRVRSKFDSLDIAQDVWASFFAAAPLGRRFETSKDLVAFLSRLARNKTVDLVRQRMNTDKRNIKRERSLDDSQRFDKNRLADGAQRTASQILMSQEDWQNFLSKQPPVYRQVLTQLRAGKSQEDIAAELKISVKTVQRIIGRVIPREPS